LLRLRRLLLLLRSGEDGGERDDRSLPLEDDDASTASGGGGVERTPLPPLATKGWNMTIMPNDNNKLYRRFDSLDP